MQQIKKHYVLNQKKKKDKTWKILNLTNSGYERYLEAIALLSVPPKNATLEIKARCGGLLLEARLIARHTGKPFPFQLHPFANRNETVRKQALHSNHSGTQRQELRNLYRVYDLANILTLLKDCQLPRTYYWQWHWQPKLRVHPVRGAEQGTAHVDRQLSQLTLCLRRSQAAELKATTCARLWL